MEKYPDFMDFLYSQCDTDDVERIEQWVEGLDEDDLIEYANKYGKHMAEIALRNANTIMDQVFNHNKEK
jgi:hypothetical protein